MRRSIQALFLFCIPPLLVPHAGIAQTVPGSIGGRVVDGSQLPIAGAQVSLINEQTRDTRTRTTDATGEFLFLSVMPAPYTIAVESKGFKRLEKTNLNLTPDERLAAGNLVLEGGAVMETVTVKAEGSVVEIESNERSAVMTSDQMAMLLTRGRDMITLLNAIPGAVGSNNEDFDNQATPSFNGVRNETNSILVDGQRRATIRPTRGCGACASTWIRGS